MTSGPKISIIIPVYNVEEYLVKCLESLINQTLKDIEIICINDGSTDNSLSILEAFAQKDSRITIINQENQGQGTARNLGISIAKGEYIGFVDPDDWVSLYMYEDMYNQGINLNSEIIICNFLKYMEETKKTYQYNLFTKAISPTKISIIDIPLNENIDKKLINEILLVSPCYTWNRIYKTEFIKSNNVEFSKSKCFEDCIFILKSHILAENISYINNPYYFYRIRESSTLRSFDDRYLILLETINELKDFLIKIDMFKTLQSNLDYFIVI